MIIEINPEFTKDNFDNVAVAAINISQIKGVTHVKYSWNGVGIKVDNHTSHSNIIWQYKNNKKQING